MINVYYTSFFEPFSPEKYDFYLHQLPVRLQEENLRFRRWQDRHANLIGKVMLYQRLLPYTTPVNPLELVQYTPYKRPFIPGVADFNLSHSGNYVVLALGSEKGVCVGIDIEKIRPVTLNDFQSVMTPRQWQHIQQAANPLHQFYTYWAMKESIIKVIGRGLSIPLDQLEFQSDTEIIYEGTAYFLTRLSIDDSYPCFLATPEPDTHIQVIQMEV